MFTTMPTPMHKLCSKPYTPTKSSPLSSSPLRQSPSPLSARHTNVPSASPHIWGTMMSPTPTPTKSAPMPIFHFGARDDSVKREPKKRVTKPNPLLQRTGEEGRETRRKLFLKRVKEEGVEKRWAKRGGDEELARKVYFLEERRERERLRRELGWEVDEEEEFDGEEVDEVARMEEEELDALVRAGEEAEKEMRWGSDEEEYDDIFLEMGMEGQETYELPPLQQGDWNSLQHPQIQQSHQGHEQDLDQDMMDVS